MSVIPAARRSAILSLASDDCAERERAFDTLVGCYWKPLYKYARVQWRRSPGEAEDLTRSFFARAFEKETLATYDADTASFRTFLRLLFDDAIANENKGMLRIKRGGTQSLDFASAEAEVERDAAARSLTPEELFQREWVRSVFALAVERLRAWCDAEGKATQFAIFEAYDLDGDRGAAYRSLAERYGIAEAQVTNFLAATRRRFREIVLEALREVTTSEAEFRREARALLGIDS